ncbi:uncharacterized protein [Fopius arisanus]|uniref:Uncharacterized protein n=2 Tax=Fopius arisanus TaxID=64838 RepID=A0A9R1SWM7_9HYME|nr:PREDICTED: uncharacterized protein LOC105263760 [Fopius arisanus]
MIETLIPFILVAQVPIDTYDVYYGLQYTFNVSNTLEYDIEGVTQHCNIVGKLKCRNSGAYSLICTLTDASRQWYQEKGSNITYPDNPKYITFPIFNAGPFEILFKDGMIHSIFVDADQSITAQQIFIMEISELLNVWWMNLKESPKGLRPVMDYNFPKASIPDCQSIIKVTTLKRINRKTDFGIKSIGRRLNISSGVTYHFRKTQNAHLPCFKSLYLWYEPDANLLPKIINPTRINATSSISRVVVSENEFVSFSENFAYYCCHYNIHQRTSVTLDSIDKATSDLPIIKNPIEVFKTVESSLVSLNL